MKSTERENLLGTLKTRFEANMPRHRELRWANVQAMLEAKPRALKTLQAMEATGGEPDVISTREGSAELGESQN